MEKRGQFYLIAAIIIIFITLGLLTVMNKAFVQPKPIGFFDLSKDYEAETTKVIDYGIYNKYSPAVDIAEKVRNITEVFASSAFAKDPTVQLVFVYGNTGGYEAINTSSATSEVSYSDAGGTYSTLITKQRFGVTKGSGDLNVSIGGNLYHFNLSEQENFYFVIQTVTPTGEINIAIRK